MNVRYSVTRNGDSEITSLELHVFNNFNGMWRQADVFQHEGAILHVAHVKINEQNVHQTSVKILIFPSVSVFPQFRASL